MNAILVPVKRLSASKVRLGARLDKSQRRRLTLTMLTDVLTAVRHAPLRIVVCSDDNVRRVAEEHGCLTLRDPGPGLNPSIEKGTEAAIGCGARSLAVIPADVPLATASDIDRLFEVKSKVAIVRSPDGGTNALFRSPPDAIAPAFGPMSARLHAAKAQACGYPAEFIELKSLLLDIDTPGDLEQLAEVAPGAGSSVLSIACARQLLGLGLSDS